MTTVRAAKSKGSQFEYDVQYSLGKVYPDIYRTSERGFQLEYDLHSDEGNLVVECKRLKSLSWKQAEKFYYKLADRSPEGYKPYLVFKSNQQPALVMFEKYELDKDAFSIYVKKFYDVFGVTLEKHPSTRKRRKENDTSKNGDIQ